MYQGEDYHAIDWSQQVPDEKVAVIHILAVSPGYQGKGIGSEMIREAIRMAKSKGMQAIRLDALASNTPAHKLYERLGFDERKIQIQHRGAFHPRQQSDCRFLHENLWFYHRLGWHSAQRGDDAGQHAHYPLPA